METMKVLKELGANFGILLSEKDSIVYPQTLVPELRAISNRREQVHHVPDYIGCLLYTSPSPRDRSVTRMPSSA